MVDPIYESPLLTEEEAAGYCRCKPRTLRAWRSLKTGPTVTWVGDLARYNKTDLDAWLESRREPMSLSQAV